MRTWSKQFSALAFAKTTTALQQKGFDVNIDTTDATNPKLIAQKHNVVYTVDKHNSIVMKDLILSNGRKLSLTKKFSTVHFYHATTFYISDEVVNFIN